MYYGTAKTAIQLITYLSYLLLLPFGYDPDFLSTDDRYAAFAHEWGGPIVKQV